MVPGKKSGLRGRETEWEKLGQFSFGTDLPMQVGSVPSPNKVRGRTFPWVLGQFPWTAGELMGSFSDGLADGDSCCVLVTHMKRLRRFSASISF
jgi:hypothetical protein